MQAENRSRRPCFLLRIAGTSVDIFTTASTVLPQVLGFGMDM
ncbi:hypothetical protein ALIPUT_00453 [Alistipes putredinis DSM 17216]|uniref:Uncharacterized protein n=1 Tax=Alistipes putredinis DSM 17216 TaxID=445970 RepID=B0MTA2_9BACT|nr:hypothetical protein ALIPUT_00453 [Alistipes putredinis DSM 17216]